MARKRIFIGSSTEGLSVAYSIQENLDHEAEITVWPQGVFRPTRSTLDSLLEASKRFDAGIFVFSGDDVAIKRGTTATALRDNVLFELGIFIGQLGPDKCFIVKPRSLSSLDLPTDLLGIEPLQYDDRRDDGNLNAALGPACNRVRLHVLGRQQPRVAPAPELSLLDFLTSRAFLLIYNPKTQRSKRIRFGVDGLVIEGNNKNEHSWRLNDGHLELIQLDGRIHSRFAYDPDSKRFVSTDEPDTLSNRGQTIILDDQEEQTARADVL